MKVVGMIQSTATQEVEAKGEEYVAAREQLLASIYPRDSSGSTFAGTLRRPPFRVVSTLMLTPPAD